MSAKLLKSLAAGKCLVKNSIAGELVVYFPNLDTGAAEHLVIKSNLTVDLMKYADVKQLRKSPNLKNLVNEGKLKVITSE
jgi:hypothetical protein